VPVGPASLGDAGAGHGSDRPTYRVAEGDEHEAPGASEWRVPFPETVPRLSRLLADPTGRGLRHTRRPLNPHEMLEDVSLFTTHARPLRQGTKEEMEALNRRDHRSG